MKTIGLIGGMSWAIFPNALKFYLKTSMFTSASLSPPCPARLSRRYP